MLLFTLSPLFHVLTIIFTSVCSHSHSLGNLGQLIHSYIKAICVIIYSRIA